MTMNAPDAAASRVPGHYTDESSPFGEQIDRLKDTAAMLEQQLARMHAKLGPILAQRTEMNLSEVKNDKRIPTYSAHVETLLTINDRLGIVGRDLAQLFDRIEV